MYLLEPSSPSCPARLAGGKGRNLWLLGRGEDCQVPPWFCVTTDSFSSFVEVSVTMCPGVLVLQASRNFLPWK